MSKDDNVSEHKEELGNREHKRSDVADEGKSDNRAHERSDVAGEGESDNRAHERSDVAGEGESDNRAHKRSDVADEGKSDNRAHERSDVAGEGESDNRAHERSDVADEGKSDNRAHKRSDVADEDVFDDVILQNKTLNKKICLEQLLPFFFNLEIDPNSPLMRSINEEGGLIFDISLSSWINENKLSYFDKQLIEDPQNLQQKILIDERIDLFNVKIQLKERLKRLSDTHNLTVRCLLASWKDSLLKYFLVMDDELEQLKFSEISELLPEFILRNLSSRLAKISKSKREEFIIKNGENLLLIDALKLTAEYINEQCEKLFPSVFCLISSAVVPNIEISKLSIDQLHALFSSQELVEHLEQEQLEYCIPLIKEKIFVKKSFGDSNFRARL